MTHVFVTITNDDHTLMEMDWGIASLTDAQIQRLRSAITEAVQKEQAVIHE